MKDHGFEQLVNFPTWEENTPELILTLSPGQFQEVYSPDKLSNHDIVAGTSKVPTNLTKITIPAKHLPLPPYEEYILPMYQIYPHSCMFSVII